MIQMNQIKPMNKKYHITSMSVQSLPNMAFTAAVGGCPPNNQLELSLDIIIPDPSDLKSTNSLEALEEFLGGTPEWCTTEMLHEALQEKYPERYL